MGMISRGSLPRMAVTCAGFSSLTRNGPETGRGEGRVIALVGSQNVRSGSLRRRAIFALSAIPLFLIAMWVRTPAIPGTAGNAARNESETSRAEEIAVRALQRSLSEAVSSLNDRAAGALDAPVDALAAFSFVDSRAPRRPGESVVVFDHDRPLAWDGKMRIDPEFLVDPLSVTFSPFYTTLNVVKVRGNRRVVASVVLDAEPPADRLTQSLESRVAPLQGVASYEFASPGDSAGGPVVLSYQGKPILRALPRLAAPAEVRFRSAAMLRARGIVALVVFVL